MSNRRTDKTALRNEAKNLIKEGNNRQETFEKLMEKHKVAKDAADVVKQVPSAKAVKKYAVWNYILIFLILSKAVIFIVEDTLFTWFLLWFGFLIFVVANRVMQFYIVVTASSTIGLLSGIGLYILADDEISLPIVLFFIVFTATLFLSFWLERKLCPPPSETKELYTNEQGHQRMRIIYQFED